MPGKPAEGGNNKRGGNTRGQGQGGTRGGPRAQRRHAEPSPHGGRREEAFVNPYNFVRLGKPRPKGLPDSRGAFSGKTGRIRCRLIPQTPIFIPDPLRTKAMEDGSKKMYFFRKDGKPVIPATSIKGMVRSVAEAVTGSCLSQFDGSRLDHRPLTAGMKAGMVKKLPEGDQPGEIQPMGLAWVSMPGGPDKIMTDEGEVDIAVLSDDYVDGQDVYVKVKIIDSYTNSRNRRIPGPFYIVTEIRKDPASGFIYGKLRRTGRSIGNKKRERVFFEIESETYYFGTREKEDYDYILEGQIERAVKRGNDVYRQSDKLEVGNLVYFEGYEMDGQRWAKHISRVEVPRKRYERGRQDLLPEGFLPCTNIKELCPACRLFGTVLKEAGEDEEYAALCGKVAFNDALPENEGGYSFKFIRFLKPLSSPNPTSCNFYLADNPEKPKVVRNYDGFAIKQRSNSRGSFVDERDRGDVFLRGRKFYWHQDYDETLAKYRISEGELKALGINRRQVSEVEALLPGTTFTFDVEFFGLTDEELGLLLWSLELDKDMMHKLGMGKPIGFGSVRIETELEFAEAKDLYLKYEAGFTAGEEGAQVKKKCVEAFKACVESVSGNRFESIERISDLKAIMSLKPDSVSYPPPQRTRRGELRGFVWFVNNKHVPLITIEDVRKGKKMS